MPPQLQHKVIIEWSPNFAYAIGLLTSDGSLHLDKRHLLFTSIDNELVKKFKFALGLKNKIIKTTDQRTSNRKPCYRIYFGDMAFYQFLNTIGLTNKKSRTIQKVDVPSLFFPDFVRGLFDGDGTFYTYWDKRWQHSFGFKLSIASASVDFIQWLQKIISRRYHVKGYVHKGAGVYNLEYVKGDSKKIINIMYYQKKILYLNRKYLKINRALIKDNKTGIPQLQKPRIAGLAHR